MSSDSSTFVTPMHLLFGLFQATSLMPLVILNKLDKVSSYSSNGKTAQDEFIQPKFKLEFNSRIGFVA